MPVPFTQFLRPFGIPLTLVVDRPGAIEEKARQLIAAGCRFEIEVLRSGAVSMTCERGDDVLAHRVCDNGPPVLENVDAIIEKAAADVLA